jgi:hypothetical protein
VCHMAQCGLIHQTESLLWKCLHKHPGEMFFGCTVLEVP